MESIEPPATTAEPPPRVIVEVMGRHAGLGLLPRIAAARTSSSSPSARSTSDKVNRLYVEHRSRPGTRRSWWSPRARTRCHDLTRCSPASLDSFGHVRLGGVGHTLANETRRAARIYVTRRACFRFTPRVGPHKVEHVVKDKR